MMNPPPTESQVSSASALPSQSRATKRIVLGWRGAGVTVSNTMARSASKGIGAAPDEVERFRLAHPRDKRFGGVEIDSVRRFAAEAQDHRLVGRVAAPREGERAKKRDLDRRDLSMAPVWTSPLANAAAAFIGPTVCDDDGPMPILNSSKTLIIA